MGRTIVSAGLPGQVDNGSTRFIRRVPPGRRDLRPLRFGPGRSLQLPLAFLFVAAAVGWSPKSLCADSDGRADTNKKAVITHVLVDKCHWFRFEFPNIPNWNGYVGYWAFESQWKYRSHQQREDGAMVLRYEHRSNDIEIILAPEVGAVDCRARILSANGNPLVSQYGGYAGYNPDVSVLHAEMFKPPGEWSKYYELVTREFMFTNDDPRGWVGLDRTKRLMPPDNSTEEGRNLPKAWVQVYLMEYNKRMRWDKYATCRHTYASCCPSHKASLPILGVVSHDGKYLFANAGDASVFELQNMWRSCFHVDPQWDPNEPAPAKRTIHTRIYVMANDKKALLKRYLQDFYPHGDSPFRIAFPGFEKASPQQSRAR